METNPLIAEQKKYIEEELENLGYTPDGSLSYRELKIKLAALRVE